MAGIGSAWSHMTEAQGTVIASLLTIMAAIAGVLLGWRLFEGRVTSMKEALEKTEGLVAAHADRMDKALEAARAEIKEIDVQVPSLIESVNRLSSVIYDQQQATGAPQTPNESVLGGGEDAWLTIRENWAQIRDRLEEIAAGPKLHGQTRAMLARIDRRQYWWLVDELSKRDLLEGKDALFREALDLWQTYKNGRLTPTPDDLKRMHELRERLAVKPDNT